VLEGVVHAHEAVEWFTDLVNESTADEEKGKVDLVSHKNVGQEDGKGKEFGHNAGNVARDHLPSRSFGVYLTGFFTKLLDFLFKAFLPSEQLERFGVLKAFMNLGALLFLDLSNADIGLAVNSFSLSVDEHDQAVHEQAREHAHSHVVVEEEHAVDEVEWHEYHVAALPQEVPDDARLVLSHVHELTAGELDVRSR